MSTNVGNDLSTDSNFYFIVSESLTSAAINLNPLVTEFSPQKDSSTNGLKS